MPRVLVLVKGLGLGGAERLVVESVAHAHRGRSLFKYEVAYVLPWKDQLVDRLDRESVPAHCLGGSRGSLAQAALSLRNLSKRFDLVHAHLPSTGIVARFASAVPVVYTEHNIASSYRQPTRTMNRLTYGRNRAVTAVSEAVQKSLEGFSGPVPEVVLNGVAVEIDNQPLDVRREFEIDDDVHLLAHVGNIRPHKGHTNLIAAISTLAERRDDFLLLSAGTEKEPGDLDRIRAEADAAGVADKIRFLGRRDDAHRLIEAADLLVNPSDVEGLPVVILEAMQLRTPVIATDVGGVASVVIDHETGWLVPERDPDALASRIAALLDDPPMRKRVAGAAHSLVESEYGIGRMVADFEAIYERILA